MAKKNVSVKKPQNFMSVKGVTTQQKVLDKEANVGMTYRFLKDGKSIKWIEDFFVDSQGLKAITARIYLMEARKLISTEADMDIDFASLLHDSRYEKIWNDEKNIYVGWCYTPEENFERANNIDIVRRYGELLKSLKQRENMYGLRDKDLSIALHSNLTLTRSTRVDSFEHSISKDLDINLLTMDEKVELLKLLEESYEGDLFLTKEYIVEDDEHVEEVKLVRINNQKSSTVISEGFKEIKDQPEEEKKIEKRKTASILVKNFAPEKGTNASGVNEKLKKSMEEMIRKKFNQK